MPDALQDDWLVRFRQSFAAISTDDVYDEAIWRARSGDRERLILEIVIETVGDRLISSTASDRTLAREQWRKYLRERLANAEAEADLLRAQLSRFPD